MALPKAKPAALGLSIFQVPVPFLLGHASYNTKFSVNWGGCFLLGFGIKGSDLIRCTFVLGYRCICFPNLDT